MTYCLTKAQDLKKNLLILVKAMRKIRKHEGKEKCDLLKCPVMKGDS
jgi:hypothetical protein